MLEGQIYPGSTDEFFGGKQSDVVVLDSGNVIYVGDADPVLRLASVSPSESTGWGLTVLSERSTVKSAGDSPSITALAATSDGSLIALGVTREELSEVLLLAAPKTTTQTKDDLTAFKMEALVSELDLPVTSLCFGIFQEKKVLVYGTEEGLVERVEISSKRRVQLFKDSVYGGVKCVTYDWKIPGCVFVSFCNGTVAHIDANGRIVAKNLGFARATSPDSEDQFSLALNPADLDLLAVGSQLLHRPRFGNFRGAADRPTCGRWSADGRFFAALKARKVEVFELEDSKLKQVASYAVASELLAPLVSLAFHHDRLDRHSLLLMSASGNKSAVLAWPGSDCALREIAQAKAEAPEAADDRFIDDEAQEDVDMADVGKPAKEEEANNSKEESEEEEAGEKKKRSRRSEEQVTFQPGEGSQYQEHGKFVRKVLFWSGTGCVIRAEQRPLHEGGRAQQKFQDEEEVPAVVEVYVSQTSVKLRDAGNGWDVAAVGESGFVLGASVKRAVDDTYDLDEMEGGIEGDEELDEKGREDKRVKMKEKLSRMGCLSKISFRPFAGTKDWLAVLPLGESVKNVALLETTVAVATSTGDLRLYTVDGGVISDFFALGGRPVTMAAHKNMLFVVLEAGRGESRLQYVLMTINPLTGGLDQEVSRGDLPISSETTILTWAHVADDFVCYVSDSDLNVFGLFPRVSASGTALFKWSRVLHLARDCRRDLEGYWPVSVLERRLCCVVTTTEFYMEPKAFHTERLVPFGLKLPLHYAHNSRLEPANPEAQLVLARLHTNHLMTALTSGLNLEGVDEREVRKATIAHDKLLASIFRQYAEAGAVEKALGVAGGVFNPQSLNALLRLAATLNLRSLEDKLEAKFKSFDRPSSAAAPPAVRTPSGQAASEIRTTSAFIAARAEPEPRSVEPAMETTQPEMKKTHVNPFAKRKVDSENDVGNNKMPRAM